MDLTNLTLDVDQQITVDAAKEAVFDGIVRRMTELSTTPGGPMPMKLEQWPGGRWYRDLGDDAGHLWGHVQVIKPPTLLEISGPMFMSYPVAGHFSLRLASEGDSTVVSLRHRALGLIEEDHRQGVQEGWNSFLQDVKTQSES